jgi:FMN-dependent NADH-azoreductase
MNILHVSCSPRGHAAESYRLSRKIVDCLLESEPTATVVDRVVGNGSLPPIDEDYAISQGAPADVSQEGSAAVSDELIRELEDADVVVLGTPMHNFTVPAALKLWIDHVVRVRRTFNVSPEGKVGLLRDRPVFVAVASGGRFSGERTRQPDFLTPYLKAILGMTGLHDLTFFTVQGTAFGPDAVAGIRTVTEQMLQDYFSRERRRQLSTNAASRASDASHCAEIRSI